MSFIDLRSDTVTKPTIEMRKAMYDAEVGDDVYEEDPTVNKLESLAATLLGKDDALFVPSGTQGNQIAVLTHCNQGNEIIVEAESHIFYYEGAAISAFAGVQPRTVAGSKGAISPSDLESAIRIDDIHMPETSLICLENTHNRAGGAVVSIANMRENYAVAQKHNIPIHLDGARLFNAAAAANEDVKAFTQYTDSVQVCLSKGLGAPIGSIIAGDHSFIKSARKWRKRLGGGLRQVGVIAAPGIVALEKMRERLFEDHEKAKQLAEGLRNINGLHVVNDVDTNIVLISTHDLHIDVDTFLDQLKQNNVLGVQFGTDTVRFTTHYDVSFDDINETIQAINKIVKNVCN
jgi:threonine aldolase